MNRAVAAYNHDDVKDQPQAIILFDGVCNLCNRMVDVVIRHDPADRFAFASLQSEHGKALARDHGIDTEALSSMVLIESGQAYLRSTAALRVYRRLRGPLRLLWPFIAVPRPIRDAVYNFIAKHRYRWFGEREVCRLPTEAEQARFL